MSARAAFFDCNSYPTFGMIMPGRSYSSGDGYRYGFQGQEQDDEVKGNGNSYTTYFRQLDPRLGRWPSVDPAVIPWESSYAAMANSPIVNVDILGDSIWTTTDIENKSTRWRGAPAP